MSDLTAARPVQGAERIEALDVLRGVAVLAIFIVNIKGMGAPPSHYFIVDSWGSPLDMAIARAHKLFVDEKFFTIFTALFGCGLAIFCDRALAAGRPGVLIYRRLAVLLAIGLIHGYLIWFGDVLALYAIAGLVAVQFVRAPVRALYIGAAVFMALRMAAEFSPVTAMAEHLIWGVQPAVEPQVQDLVAKTAYLGGVGAQLAQRFDTFSHIMIGHLTIDVWRVIAIMLCGMALYRQGFLSCKWTTRSYFVAVAVGLAVTVALRVAAGVGSQATGEMIGWATLRITAHFTQAFTYAAIVMALVKAGANLDWFASAGRMALSNYLACSLIGTTMFYGHGLGLYGALSLAQITGATLAVWAVLLVWSRLWLARFRFGPFEWAWRSLTYGRLEPLRRAPGAVALETGG